MTVLLPDLVEYTNNLLNINAVSDYCPNGLQIQGKNEVVNIITGVTACEELIDAAIDLKADALIVHHGYFWKGEDPVITGMKAKRIKKLIQNDISLLAYHLPLDVHGEYGNNIQLARMLDLKVTGGLDDNPVPLGLIGELEAPEKAGNFAQRVGQILGRKALLIGDDNRQISSVGWCTGAAQSYIDRAVARGVDCYISGEISEQTVHIAREMGLVYLSCGHHATEKYGVQALGDHLARHFGINCQFVDIDNPV